MSGRPQSARPAVAVEITAERVLAARASHDRRSLETHTARALPAGAVVPSLQGQNVADAEPVRQALSAALETVGTRVRNVTVVVPDAAARVMLMDFDTFPERESEALSLLRFRLKKLLPFDAERATVTYQAFRNRGVRVVSAVAAASVVAEYESLLRDLGYNPGVVLPSIAACLGLVAAVRPTLVVKADAETTSVAIADHGELRLVRTLEGPPPASAEQLADELHPLLVYFQDTFAGRIERVLVGGHLTVDAMRPVLEKQTGAQVQELVSATVLGGGLASPQLPAGLLAGVTGAVLNL